MDIIKFSQNLAALVGSAIRESDMTKQQVSKRSGIPWTTLCRRLDHPDSSFFTVPEIISVCEALRLDFLNVLAAAESTAKIHSPMDEKEKV